MSHSHAGQRRGRLGTLTVGLALLMACSPNPRTVSDLEWTEPGFSSSARGYTFADDAQPSGQTPLGGLATSGAGLQAEYFGQLEFGGSPLRRTDPTLNFNWGQGSPAAELKPDNFSVRWSGQVQPLYSQEYTFYTVSDDGVRLWVNGVKLIDNWSDHGATENSGKILLEAGKRYTLKMEFYERGGNAVAKLRWSSPSQAKQIVPASQLFLPEVTPAPTPAPVPTPTPTPVPTPTPTPTPTPVPTPTPSPTSGSAWSDPATWPSGQVPRAGDTVVIAAGKTVRLDSSTPALAGILVDGTLTLENRDLELNTGYLMVHGSGKFQIGSPTQPFTARATLTLLGNTPSEDVMGMGSKFLGAMMGGKIEIYGEPRTSWTRLGASAAAGSSTLTLTENPGWRVGEKIVLASSSFEASEAEERSIVAVSGVNVTLDRPLSYRHFGELQTYGGKTLDARAEVGLLSRNIVIQGDESSSTSKFGGHLMIMGGSTTVRETNPALRSSAKLRGVELRRMGQFNRTGRYPIHWHFNGDSSGDFLEDSSIHDSLQRGVVLHNSDGLRIRDNVVLKTPGHSFVVEDGSERGSVFERNLGLLPQPVTLSADGLKNQKDQGAAVFWLRTAAGTFTQNVAAGGPFAGYWFDMASVPGGEASKALLKFENNTVHSQGSGRFEGEADSWALWQTDGSVPSKEGLLTFVGVTAYKNMRAIETGGRGLTRDSMLADNGMVLSKGTLKDSVVVSRSLNTDTNPEWGQSGLFAYGGYANSDGVTWVNFREGRTLARTLACGIEYPRFTNRAATLINSEPAAGCGDVIMNDTDGSLSGSGVPQKLISVEGRPNWNGAGQNRFGLLTPECRVLPTSRPDGVAICPNYDYRTLGLTYPNGPTQTFSNDDWRVDVVRDGDGIRVSPEHFRWVSYVIPGKTYRLEVKSVKNPSDTAVYGLESVPYLDLSFSSGELSNANPLPGGPNPYFEPAWTTRTVTVSAPAPSGSYRIRRCTQGETCSSDPAQWPQISASSSLASLQAASGGGYALEGGRIYFKFGGGDSLRFER